LKAIKTLTKGQRKKKEIQSRRKKSKHIVYTNWKPRVKLKKNKILTKKITKLLKSKLKRSNLKYQ
jgi:hypothetical protein